MRGRLLLLGGLVAACSGSLGGDGADAYGPSSSAATGSTGAGGSSTTRGSSSTGGPFVASESAARRLSRAELDNTLSSLLGDDTAPARQQLSEDEYSPYDNDYTRQVASAALVESFNQLARDVARRAIENQDFLDSLPCTPSDDSDAMCFRSIVEHLLSLGFRREVTSEDVDPYLTLLDYATEEVPDRQLDFYTAVELLVQSVLQDPEFLYRIEVGMPTDTAGIARLDDHEIASRMSYLLWGDMPDDTLRSLARAGTLGDAEARRDVASEMLDSDRSRRQLERFHAMWLGYRAIPHSAELTTAFAAETNALLERVLFDEPQSYMNLFSYPETYVNGLLAEHYGLPAPSGDAGWVPYGDSGRAGILSHGSVLSAFSKFSDTSPTQRGILVRTRLMCDAVPEPPPDINTDEPPSDVDATCKIERYEQHRSNAGCANCHNALDPIGFGRENYDMAGAWRDHDTEDETCLIDGRGSVEPLGEFSGPAELGRLLVDAGEVDDCVVKQYLAFALGRSLDDSETELAEPLLAGFRDSNHALATLLLDYVASEAFALRREPSEP